MRHTVRNMNSRQTLTLQFDGGREVMGRRIPAQIFETKDHAVLKDDEVVVMPRMHVHAP